MKSKSVSVMMPPLATVSVFLTLSFHSAGEIFVASTVFQVVAIFTTFRGPFLVLPVGISLGSQVFTSLNRFQVFLSTQPKRASVAASVLSQDVTTVLHRRMAHTTRRASWGKT
eukprot:GEMP01135826.1.p1 GENE.GEMP01135826.1~~GEMP01135826.1.p1  ORF type:complete len:113 (+),score=15.11 GEMP01135826.1:53-391(+)